MKRTLGLLTALTIAAAVPAQLRVFSMDGQRAATGLFYWDPAASTSPGQIFLHYGQPEWKDQYERLVTGDKAVTLRLGSNWWATLDTTTPLTIGQTKVPSGIYYLGLHKTAKAQWQLMLLDPKEVRKQKAHPGMTSGLTAKLNADLIYRKVDKHTDKLTITIKASKSDPKIGTLAIEWGNHHLQVKMVAGSGKGEAVEAGGKKNGKKNGKNKK